MEREAATLQAMTIQSRPVIYACRWLAGSGTMATKTKLHMRLRRAMIYKWRTGHS
jgi:hypothetical protein